MSKINLLNLCVDKADFKQNLTKLEKLADSKEGPLRIEYKNEVPHLRIRTWKTYFFETFMLDEHDIKAIERKTAETISSYVGTFLKEIEKQAKPKPASNTVLIQKTQDPHISANQIFFKLQAKASGKNLEPNVSGTAWMRATTPQIGYRIEKVKSGSVTTFHGQVMVPKGLSIGKIPVENVAADVRFLSSEFTTSLCNSYGRSQYLVKQNKKKSLEPGNFDANDYYNFYKHNLEQVEDFETSIAIQLVSNRTGGSNEENQNGAWQAAKEFIRKRSNEGKSVSVLLCTNNLPEVKSKPDQRRSTTRNQPAGNTNYHNDNDSDSESSYLG